MNYSESFQDTHDCPGGCGTPVVRNMFSCTTCWRRLPQEHRTPILTSRWANDHAAHSKAIVEAMAWYRIDGDRRTAQAIQEAGDARREGTMTTVDP